MAKKPAVKKTAPKRKPAVKKTAAKKPAAKKVAKKTVVKKPSKDLLFASDQESFWVQNGEILNSLIALRDALENMDKGVFEFHAQGDQNDFSIWVETVLCDADCAADIAKAKTQKSARTAVNKHLKRYVN